jgi:Tfp pilus assembly protein PilF
MTALLLAAFLIALPTVQSPMDPGLHSEQARAYYHFSLAQFFRLEGEQQRATEELRKALEYDPESSSLHFSLAQSLATPAFWKNQPENAKEPSNWIPRVPILTSF